MVSHVHNSKYEHNIALCSFIGSLYFEVWLIVLWRNGEGRDKVVWSKSFEISIEVVNGSLQGKIVKRGRAFSSWIGFR